MFFYFLLNMNKMRTRYTNVYYKNDTADPHYITAMKYEVSISAFLIDKV